MKSQFESLETLADGLDAVFVTAEFKELLGDVDFDALAAGDVEAAMDPELAGTVVGRQIGRAAVKSSMSFHPARPVVEYAAAKAAGGATGFAAKRIVEAASKAEEFEDAIPIAVESAEEAEPFER